jgi:hypothetical protein
MLERIDQCWLWVLFIAVSLLTCMVANAQTTALKRNERLLTISPVTACEDGTTDLTQCPFDSYRIEHASLCTATTWDVVADVPSSTLTYKATGLTSGNHCWRVRAVAGSFVTAPSAILPNSWTTVTALNPGRPGGISVSQ